MIKLIKRAVFAGLLLSPLAGFADDLVTVAVTNLAYPDATLYIAPNYEDTDCAYEMSSNDPESGSVKLSPNQKTLNFTYKTNTYGTCDGFFRGQHDHLSIRFAILYPGRDANTYHVVAAGDLVCSKHSAMAIPGGGYIPGGYGCYPVKSALQGKIQILGGANDSTHMSLIFS